MKTLGNDGELCTDLGFKQCHNVSVLIKLFIQMYFQRRFTSKIPERPQRTFIHKAKAMPGSRPSRTGVLLGSRTAGRKWKPSVISRWEPQGLRHIDTYTRGAYRSSKKSWMAQLLFQDGPPSTLASEKEKYPSKNSMPFTILLILDSAPRHPSFIGDLLSQHQNGVLPPNTISLIQPTDQGIPAAWKACCLQRTFAQAVAATEETWGLSGRITAPGTAAGTVWGRAMPPGSV